jgi:DNA-binding response OmpR family regulator
MRVLVVEDEVVLARAIVDGLRQAGAVVDVAHDGAEALYKAGVTPYDVVVLDRDLPEVHGDDVCRSLVAAGGETRVLMLTASAALGDRVQGLDLGADDYLAKPFAFDELVARIRALARRTPMTRPPVIVAADIVVDTARREATRAGRRLELSPKEYTVLEILVAAQGRVVSQEEHLDRAWDENTDPFTNAVRVAMVGLRRKLGDPPVISTVTGAGYRIGR